MKEKRHAHAHTDGSNGNINESRRRKWKEEESKYFIFFESQQKKLYLRIDKDHIYYLDYNINLLFLIQNSLNLWYVHSVQCLFVWNEIRKEKKEKTHEVRRKYAVQWLKSTLRGHRVTKMIIRFIFIISHCYVWKYYI
jgi:hypothetical protein